MTYPRISAKRREETDNWNKSRQYQVPEKELHSRTQAPPHTASVRYGSTHIVCESQTYPPECALSRKLAVTEARLLISREWTFGFYTR